MTFLDLVPSPHDTLQADQSDHSRTQGHGILPQEDIFGGFSHFPPFLAGAMTFFRADQIPDPHVTLHSLHELHSEDKIQSTKENYE